MAKKTFIPPSKNYGLDIFTLPFAAKKSDLPFYVSDAEAPEMIRSGAAEKNKAVTPVKNTESKSSGISASSGSDAARQSVVKTSAAKTVNTEPYASKSKDRREGAAEIAERLYPELTDGERGALEREGSTLDTLGADLEQRAKRLDFLKQYYYKTGIPAAADTYDSEAQKFNDDFAAYETRFAAYDLMQDKYNKTHGAAARSSAEIQSGIDSAESRIKAAKAALYDARTIDEYKQAETTLKELQYSLDSLNRSLAAGSAYDEAAQRTYRSTSDIDLDRKTAERDIADARERSAWADNAAEQKAAERKKNNLEKRLEALNEEYDASSAHEMSVFYSGIPGAQDYAQFAGVKSKEERQSDIAALEKEIQTINSTAMFDSFTGEAADPAASRKLGQLQSQIEKLRQYDYMSDEEAGIYNYLLAKEGEAPAKQYLKTISDNMAQREGLAIAQGLEGKTGQEILYGINSGLEQFGSGIKQLFTDEAVTPSASQYAGAYMRQDLEDNGPKILGSSLAQVGYDLLSASANMAPSILLSAVSGGLISPVIAKAMGAASMGASAAGSAYSQMILEGHTKKEAKTYAALIGASETTLQYFIGGIGKLGGVSAEKLAVKIAGLDSALARFTLGVGSKAAFEYTEESLQALLQPAIAAAVFGEEYDVDPEDVAYAGLLGALTVGLIEGPSAAAAAWRGSGSPVLFDSAMEGYRGETAVDYFEGIDTPEGLRTRRNELVKRYNTDNGTSPDLQAHKEINTQYAMKNAFYQAQALAASAVGRKSGVESGEAAGYNETDGNNALTGTLGNDRPLLPSANVSGQKYVVDPVMAALIGGGQSASGTVSKSTAAQQEAPDVSRALLGWDTQTPGADSQAAPAVGEAKGFNIQAVPSDIRALLGMTDDSAAGTVSKTAAAQQATPDVSRALLGWDTQTPGAAAAGGSAKGFNMQAVPYDIRALLGWDALTPGANSQAVPAVGEAKGINIQAVPYDIRALLGMTDDSSAGTVSKSTAAQQATPDVSRALLGWEGKNAVENGSAPGYNNNWKNAAEASALDSLADNPLLLTGKYSKYRDSADAAYAAPPLPPGLQDDASAFAYIDTQKAYESARAEMKQSGDLPAEGAGNAGTIADGGGNKGFTYKHNPSNNPKVLYDANEDSTAIYGYRPSKDGSLKAFADGDWSNPDYVEGFRQDRISYHNRNEAGVLELISEMQNQGYADGQIVRAVVEFRNQSRLRSYLDDKGNIIDQKGYAQALAHCKTYEQLRAEGKTDKDILKSATRGNPGMDACTGLYDDNYNQYTEGK